MDRCRFTAADHDIFAIGGSAALPARSASLK
jgi:hypothetical protein